MAASKKWICTGIYPSNFDIRQTAQETQFSNRVLKLSLHKILFQSILVLNLHSKYISLPGFFYLKLWDVKRVTFFKRFTPWILTEVPPWTCCGDCSTSRPPPALHNIGKLNFCSKTDISKTAWINACMYYWISSD